MTRQEQKFEKAFFKKLLWNNFMHDFTKLIDAF